MADNFLPMETLGEVLSLDETSEWRVEYIGNLVSLEYGSALAAKTRTGRGFPVYGSNGVVGYHEAALITRPGVIVGRKGSVGAVQWSDEDYWPIDTTYWVNPKVDLDLRWIFECLKLIGLESLDSSTGVPGLNRNDVYKISVHVPPLKEQRQIGKVFDEVDKVIRSTEDIIVKYRGIFAGLASDLLDGRFKLLGDTGDYQECRIGDLGSVVGGGTPSRDREEYWNGSVPWLTPGELTGINDKFVSRSKECISELGLTASNARLVPAGSLLVTSRASIGFCALAGIDLATNQGFQNLIPNVDSVDSSFLYYLGKTLRREMIRRASGTTFLEMPKREFERIKVQMPPLKEQRRIARVLDDFDETIQASRRQLEKLRWLRSGLAADLFSGKVRTVKV